MAIYRGATVTRHRLMFLDFDGVLHPYPPYVGRQHLCWLPHVEALVLPHADVRVVIHSSWRYEYSVDLLRELLGQLGPRLLGVTPLGQRYKSITEFLSHGDAISDYRILDDMAEEFPQDPAPPELILCTGRTGVSAPRIRAALRQWLDATRPSRTGPGNSRGTP